MSAKLVEPCAIRLKKAMDIRNVRATELCEKTKVPKSAISHYLKGSFVPKQDRAYIIAKALNVNPAWLMGFDAPMEIYEEAKKQPTNFDGLSDKQKAFMLRIMQMSDTDLDRVEKVLSLVENKV